MKREFLKSFEGKEVNDEIINQIFAEYGKAVKDKDEKIASLNTEVETLKTNAKETDDKIKSLTKENWEEKYNDLSSKYEKDTKELNERLSKTNYDNKIKELLSSIDFSSESAKKGFMSDLKGKELKLEGETLLGFNDFVSEYKKNDPGAFKSEEKEQLVTTNTGDSHGDTDVNESALRQAMGL